MAAKSVAVRLTQSVTGLGRAGAVVNVSFAYARNFLLPRGAAQIVSAGTASRAIGKLQTRETIAVSLRQSVATIAKELADKVVTLTAPANANGKLFASVSAEAVAKALGIDAIFRLDPIKSVGRHPVKLDFGHDISATITVVVQPEPGSHRGKEGTNV